MPWDNNTGGGGRNNNGGPWGQPPGGTGGPRKPGGTPSLEELLNRGKDRFKGGIPGGMPGGRWALIGGVAVIVGFWLLQCVYTIAPQEVGVELLFGKARPVLSEPGLHFLVWPIETVERVAITENQTEIGTINAGANNKGEGLMLSADQNIVDIKFSVLWSVTDPTKFLFNVRDPDDMVRSAGESAMRQVVGRRPAQDVFRDDKAGIRLDVQQITQAILDKYQLGVKVARIAIENVAPPAEVAEAFDEVQRAGQDADRFQEEARQYANTLIGGANGQAAQIREDAAAYKDRVVKEAEGEAQRFTLVYQQYIKAPEVTRKRLYLETMEQVLGGANKVVVDKSASGSGVLPYLALPQVQTKAPAVVPPSTDTTLTAPTTTAPTATTTGN